MGSETVLGSPSPPDFVVTCTQCGVRRDSTSENAFCSKPMPLTAGKHVFVTTAAFKPPQPSVVTEHVRALNKAVSEYTELFNKRADLQRDRELREKVLATVKEQQLSLDQEIEKARLAIKNILGSECPTR